MDEQKVRIGLRRLKEDLSLDGFCLQSFDATDAAFRTGRVLYNLLAGFRETVLPRSWFERRLRAVREFVFLAGEDLIYQGHNVTVRLPLPKPDRPEFFQALTDGLGRLTITEQLEWSTGRRAKTYLRNPTTSPVGCHIMFHLPHHFCLRENLYSGIRVHCNPNLTPPSKPSPTVPACGEMQPGDREL